MQRGNCQAIGPDETDEFTVPDIAPVPRTLDLSDPRVLEAIKVLLPVISNLLLYF